MLKAWVNITIFSLWLRRTYQRKSNESHSSLGSRIPIFIVLREMRLHTPAKAVNPTGISGSKLHSNISKRTCCGYKRLNVQFGNPYKLFWTLIQTDCIAMDTKVIEIVFLTVRWATKGLNSSGGGRHGCFNLIWKKIITPSASQKLQIGPVERPLVM